MSARFQRNRPTVRARLALAGLMLSLMGLPACRSTQPDVPPPVPGSTRQHQGVELRLFGYAPELRPSRERALIRAFEDATGITMRVIPLPDASEEAYVALQRLTLEGAVDVLTLDVIWTAAFAPSLLDLGPELGVAAGEHFPATLANGMWNGKLLAVPLYATVGMLFSRTDLLAQYGYSRPPTTWEELEAMARTLQTGERQKTAGFAGFVWPGRPYEGLTCFGLEVQWSHGAGSFVEEATRQPNVTSPPAIAAYRRAQSWVGRISPSSVNSYESPDAVHVFRQGLAAFMRGWATSYGYCDSPRSPIRGKFTISELPHAAGPHPSAGTLGGWMLGIARQTAHPEAARLFVRYMTSPEVQAWRAKRDGTPPSLPALYRDAEILALQPHLAAVEPILQRAIVRPSAITGDRYEELSQVYSQGLSAILRGSPPQIVAPLMRNDLANLLSR